MRLEWISAAEGEKVKRVVNEMVGQVQKLGPLGIPQKFEEWDKEMEHFAAQVEEKDAASPAVAPRTTNPRPRANKMEAAHA